MKIAWATDLHLDHLDEMQIVLFGKYVRDSGANSLVVSGDIANADSLRDSLLALAQGFAKDIYFVLGNHDFYGNSVPGVKKLAAEICRGSGRIYYLPEIGIVPLSKTAALVGVDGFADGWHGNALGSSFQVNDCVQIEDLKGLSRKEELTKRRELAVEEAKKCQSLVSNVFKKYEQVVVVTHIPPFAEACWQQNKEILVQDYLPWYTCKAIGDVLLGAAICNPSRQTTVLCGHTHARSTVFIRKNLMVCSGAAVYGKPDVERVMGFI